MYYVVHHILIILDNDVSRILDLPLLPYIFSNLNVDIYIHITIAIHPIFLNDVTYCINIVLCCALDPSLHLVPLAFLRDMLGLKS